MPTATRRTRKPRDRLLLPWRMSVNKALAERFDRMSQMIELLGGDRFRANAHAKAARVIRGYPKDLASLVDDKKALTSIDGIGARTADKIIEFVRTGRISEYDELVAQVPSGLLIVMDVPGMGPKTVKLIWEQLGVTDVEALKKAIEDGSLLALPRMGQKTIDNIKESIAFAEQAGARLWIGQAMPVAEGIVGRLAKVKGVQEIAFAGSLRRGKETIGDIDILACTDDAEGLREAFVTMPEVEKVLSRGETKCSVRLRIGSDMSRWSNPDVEPSDRKGSVAQVDLRLVPKASWGAAMMYFTGSKEHNVRLRERAIKQGFTLNEYGLFPLDDEQGPPQQRGVKPAAGKTEESIYKKLGFPYLPPEIREDWRELELTETPRLIELSDIKAELHAHTTESDGSLSLEQLAAEATGRGFHTIAVTDHSRSSVQANGLSVERLRAQIERVRAFGAKTKGISVLVGSEVDIHADGKLDYDDELLAELDVVVASPHASLKQNPKVATKRLLAAIEHPLVHIIGHPTGRLINRRPGLEPAMDEIIAAAVQHETALEINAHWMRLDLRDSHVRAAVEAGALIAIDCDVHGIGDFDNLRYGVLTGRRGWLTPAQCINTWSKQKLHAWLKRKRS